MILMHIMIALASLACTTFLYFRPSKRGFHIAGGLVAATLASGTDLVMSTHAPLASACASGLFYLGLVSLGLLGAFRKLAASRD